MQILLFIVVLVILVLFHEWGHFMVARWAGVKVEEFGFGFPPRLMAWKGKLTEYSINWLPLGGFVRLKGEDGNNGDADSFGAKSKSRRALILLAGVMMNWVLAFLLFTVVNIVGVRQPLDESKMNVARDIKMTVLDIVAASPAKTAGLEIGDTVVSIDGQVASEENIPTLVKTAFTEQRAVELVIQHEKTAENISVSITPTKPEGAEFATIGIAFAETGLVKFPVGQAIVEGAKDTVRITRMIVVGLYDLIARLVQGEETGAQVSGPIGIAILTGQIARQGFVELLQFMGLLSVNLAVLNLIPFPALDGGRLLFIGIEAIKRRPISQRVEGIAHMTGFAILMMLVVLVSIRDIMHLW